MLLSAMESGTVQTATMRRKILLLVSRLSLATRTTSMAGETYRPPVQMQLLSLQPSDTGVATLAAQGGVDPSGRGGPSDSAAVVEQLCRVEGCRVPPGRESDAALFLQILDANAFQCE